MFAAIHRRATARNVIVALIALGAVTLISKFLAVPAYRTFAAGFDPLNSQYRLTWQMVAIQRGAFVDGIGPAYLTYALLDVVWQWMLMTFLVLVWAWFLNHSPRKLMSDVWLLFPVLAAALGVAESAGFLVIVFADSHEPLHELTDKVLLIHKLKFFLRDVDLAITVTLGLFAVYFRWRGVAPKESE